MNFTNEQRERYSRHFTFKKFGIEGQTKLLNSKVLIIGAGGLGSPVTMYLAAAGVGNIGIADPDEVSLSNLQRQIIHQTRDVGRPKVISAQETVHALNPDVNVVTYHEWITSQNIMDIINDLDYDFIIDATDNLSTKFLINDTCVQAQKPFSHAGILQFLGQIYTYVPKPEAACYRCIFGSPPPPDSVPSGQQVGILSVIPGILGTLRATETIKYITGLGELLVNKLLIIDAENMEFNKINVQKNDKCPICGDLKR